MPFDIIFKLVLFLIFCNVIESSRITTRQLALYTFREGEGNQTQDVANWSSSTSLGPLQFTDVNWINNSAGVEFPAIASSRGSSTFNILRTYFQTDSQTLSSTFSIELWFKMNTSSHGFILGIGDFSDIPLNSQLFCSSLGFALLQEGTTIRFFVAIAATSSCIDFNVSLPDNINNQIVQLTITTSSNAGMPALLIYLNGSQLDELVGSPINSSLWPIGRLEIGLPLNSSSSILSWFGEIYQLAIYGISLSQQQILVNLANGLESSFPSSPSSSSIQASSQNLVLSSDSVTLITLSSSSNSTNLVYYLTSLPRIGTLSDSAASSPYIGNLPLQLNSPLLNYQAPLLFFNTSDDFTYFVSDGIANSSISTVNITILGLTPPSPSNLSADSFQGVSTTIDLLQSLTGIPASLTPEVYIMSLPSMGNILTDNDLPIDIIDQNEGIQVSNQVHYRSLLTHQIAYDGLAVFAEDSFSYKVVWKNIIDNSLYGTSNAVVVISILNHLNATGGTQTALEDKRTTLELPGMNEQARSFQAVVLSLPSNGDLYLPDTPIKLIEGFLLPNITVDYIAKTDWIGGDSFNYAITDQEGWISPSSIQSIQVLEVNDLPSLIVSSMLIKLTDINKPVILSIDLEDSDPNPTYAVQITALNQRVVIQIGNVPNITVINGGTKWSFDQHFTGSYTDVRAVLAGVWIMAKEAGDDLLVVQVGDGGFTEGSTASLEIAVKTPHTPTSLRDEINDDTNVLMVWLSGLLFLCCCVIFLCIQQIHSWRHRHYHFEPESEPVDTLNDDMHRLPSPARRRERELDRL